MQGRPKQNKKRKGGYDRGGSAKSGKTKLTVRDYDIEEQQKDFYAHVHKASSAKEVVESSTQFLKVGSMISIFSRTNAILEFW